MTTPKLSVAIATYNEEKNIKRALSSVANLADEIVVVDGSSSDKTPQIAKALKAKIITTGNKQMFHINKNLAIDNCQGEWILLLDADESVSKPLSEEIKKVIDSKPKENGFWVNRRNWFLDGFLKKGGAYPDAVIRLFKKGKGRLPEVNVHEQVEITGSVGSLQNDLLHFADPTFSRYLQRANRYTTQTALEIAGQDPDTGPLAVINYMLVKPVIYIIRIYLRHRGYKDGFRGFVWALFSGFHYFYSYVKYWHLKQKKLPIYDN